jgi:hypothetical protein
MRILPWLILPSTSAYFKSLYGILITILVILISLSSNLLKCFVTRELMRWPGIEAMYGTFLRKTPVFESNKRWEDLHTRVIEHVRNFVESNPTSSHSCFLEHSCCCSILHADYFGTSDITIRPYLKTNGRNPRSIGRLWHDLG